MVPIAPTVNFFSIKRKSLSGIGGQKTHLMKIPRFILPERGSPKFWFSRSRDRSFTLSSRHDLRHHLGIRPQVRDGENHCDDDDHQELNLGLVLHIVKGEIFLSLREMSIATTRSRIPKA